MFKESAVDLNSAFYPKPAFYSQSAVCILHSVCILPLVRSLQSAVRSLRFTLTAIEITGHCIPLPDKVNRMNAPLTYSATLFTL